MQAAHTRYSSPSTSPRDRILAAARRVFLDGPPELATMDALAQEAGMSKKTIYREFKSQFELLAALACENVELADAPPPTARSDIELELYGLLSRLVAQMLAPRSLALLRLIMSEVRRYPELMLQPRPKGAPQELIARWLNTPAVRARYVIEDAEDAAGMLLGMVLQDTAFKLLVTGVETVPPHVLEQRTRRAVAIFLRGVRRDAV
jgi:AcrR family transcriptional regulator